MLRCASPFVTAAYVKVRLIPQDSRALPAAFLRSRPISATFKTFYGAAIILALYISRKPDCATTKMAVFPRKNPPHSFWTFPRVCRMGFEISKNLHRHRGVLTDITTASLTLDGPIRHGREETANGLKTSKEGTVMSLDFEFTPEQKMIEESVWRWASSWLEPQMEELYEKDQMPPDLFLELGKMGLNGIAFEEEYGGTGLGYVETLLVYETIGRVSNALAMTVGASQTLCFDNFRRNAAEEQKAAILPKACSGEYIGCLGTTEPNAGPAATGRTPPAGKVGNRYVVNGSKTFITNGTVADFMLLYAKTNPARGAHGISAFYFLTEGMKGLHREKINKWGMRTSPTALITFEDIELPEENLIGGLNRGGGVLTNGLCTERIPPSGRRPGPRPHRS